jgi:hypothetical protein
MFITKIYDHLNKCICIFIGKPFGSGAVHVNFILISNNFIPHCCLVYPQAVVILLNIAALQVYPGTV